MKALAFRLSALLLALSVFSLPAAVNADSKHEIDANVKTAIATLYSNVAGGEELANRAVALLVFPRVNKAGIGVGSEYGEGALLEGGNTSGYYSTFTISAGPQVGALVKSQVYMFMTKQALADFNNRDEWAVGATGSLAVLDMGQRGHVSPEAVSEPVLSFTYDTKGIMLGAGLGSTKIKRLNKIGLKGVNFALNSADLTAASRAILDDAVAALKRNNSSVEVAAHTCNVGTSAYNQALSERRAESVKQYLVSRGISADRLTARGYGATQPIASNDTRPGRIKNRRVELRLSDSGGGVAAFNH